MAELQPSRIDNGLGGIAMERRRGNSSRTRHFVHVKDSNAQLAKLVTNSVNEVAIRTVIAVACAVLVGKCKFGGVHGK